ncbi:MAG: hypothetical protein HQL77_09330 [Magnetococcales bacterium]|nr:hypothetical protein [Magnetococcales bacterium]
MNTDSRGAITLLASLLIMMLLTMMVISSLNVSTVNFRVVGNLQASRSLDATTQQALETVLTKSSVFSSSGTTTTFTSGSDSGTVSAPACIYSRVSSGSSAVWGMSPRDNTWELTATITSSSTGAVATIHQGVQIRQLAGVCCTDC